MSFRQAKLYTFTLITRFRFFFFFLKESFQFIFFFIQIFVRYILRLESHRDRRVSLKPPSDEDFKTLLILIIPSASQGNSGRWRHQKPTQVNWRKNKADSKCSPIQYSHHSMLLMLQNRSHVTRCCGIKLFVMLSVCYISVESRPDTGCHHRQCSH